MWPWNPVLPGKSIVTPCQKKNEGKEITMKNRNRTIVTHHLHHYNILQTADSHAIIIRVYSCPFVVLFIPLALGYAHLQMKASTKILFPTSNCTMFIKFVIASIQLETNCGKFV
jgi:hypothetical protein